VCSFVSRAVYIIPYGVVVFSPIVYSYLLCHGSSNKLQSYAQL